MKHRLSRSIASSIRIWTLAAAIASVAFLGGAARSYAGPQAQAGPYQVEVSSDPAVVPAGPAKLIIRVTHNGQPVQGANVRVLAQMPGMPMGEHEEGAVPQADQPGVYHAPAQFGMEGAYHATVQVSGSEGEGTAVIPLKTGQNTATPAGSGAWHAGLWRLLGLGAVCFVLYRMRRTGQHPNLRPLRSWQFLVGTGLLLLTLAISSWAVKKYTAPGHMSVIDAQAMDMTVMKPPVGAVPVAAMAAKRQTIDSTVSYTGAAVSFVDQEVSARVTGTLLSMPFYPGQRVSRGQLIARLDSAELASRANEQAAGRAMAEHAQQIARMQYQQSLGARSQAEAQIVAAHGAVTDAEQGKRKAQAAVKTAQTDLVAARGELTAAQQEEAAADEDRAGAQADLEGAETQISDAQAQLTAARADELYQSERLKRSQALLTSGAVSREEFEQDRATSENAAAKVRQAQARVQQVTAAVRSAQSRIKKAEAMLGGARARVAQVQAKLQGSQSRIEEAQADVVGAAAKVAQMQASVEAAQGNARAFTAASNAAQHEILHTQAGVQQAQALLTTAQVVRGYTEILSNVDGVVTQRLIGPGTLIGAGQPILRISQISPIRLQANVAESDLAKIRVRGRVRVHGMGDGGRVTEAQITAVFPSVDPSARTGVVEAVLPNRDGHFLPGQYVKMDLTTGQARNAVVVPARSVVWEPQATSAVLATAETPNVWVIQAGEPEKTVYTCTMHPEVKQDKPGKCPACAWELTPQVAGGKWRAHRVSVTVGLVNPQFAEVRSGIRPGDQVIYAGAEGLHEGDPVVPTEWGSAGALSLPPATGEAAPGTVYTCPMHPEVRSDKPGDCPKCGMKLQPVQPGAAGSGAATGSAPAPAGGSAALGAANNGAYYCPMHPEVRSNKPGKCPKCGMDLQPEPSAAPVPKPSAAVTASGFYCPMHPEVRSPRPGKCPKCGMDLQPVSRKGGTP